MSDVPAYPMARVANRPFDPPPELRDLATRKPIQRVTLWDGSTPWLVTGYAEQRTLLLDARISADSSRPGFPCLGEGQYQRRNRRSFLNMDGSEHRRLRHMVAGSFGNRRVDALRPAIQRIVDGLIDTMLGGPAPVDLVATLALPVPSLVICELLGVPYADHDFFQDRSSILVRFADQAGTAAQLDLIQYLDRLVARKLADPGDDLLSELARDQVATGELSEHDLALVGALLLIAGHETTANMIALGTLALLTHPDQLAALRDTDDPALFESAVEELLRYLTVAHTGLRRVALADIDVGGQVIRAGEGVIMAIDQANWAESVFDGPGRLDVFREARGHMAFGFGAHQCLGAPLARAELRIVYRTLLRRIPKLRLAGEPADVPVKRLGLFHGVTELPVTW